MSERPTASVLLSLEDDAEAAAALLRALTASRDPRVEVVVVRGPGSPEVADLLARMPGDAVLLDTPQALGRRAALSAAARAASSEVCIALGPLARPQAGFIAPLANAVRGGAPLAGPVLRTAGGEVHGLALADGDRSLLPRRADDPRPLAALPLECLAAPRELMVRSGGWFDPTADHWELVLAEGAAREGEILLVEDAVVERAPGPVPLSVVICTQDREDQVEPCVTALVEDGVLACGGEILLVDNASADRTAEVAGAVARRFGSGVVVLHEPVPGLSRARTTGAAAARHDVLVFFDDDARPAPGWYDSLSAAFADPSIAVAGGPIAGVWAAGAEHDALPHVALGFFGILNLQDRDHDLVPPESPYGGNFGVRRGVLDAFGGFDVRMGASEGRRLGGEETLLSQQVHERGLGRLRYVPGAAVAHLIAAERAQDPSFPLLRAYRWGVESVWRDHVLGQLDEHALREAAARNARDLADQLPVADGTTGDALWRRLSEAPMTTPRRLTKLKALGELAACAHLLGTPAVRLPSGARLHLSDENGCGLVPALHRQALRDPGARTSAGVTVDRTPLVSCIVPTYQMAAYLPEALDSALAQDWPADALEVIVIDDGSTDDTAAVCAAYGARVRYVHQENQGVVKAVERGVREARGEVLAFLDADDAWLPHKTRVQVARLLEHPEVDLVCGGLEEMDAEGRLLHRSQWARDGLYPTRGRVLGELLASNFVTTGAMVVRASAKHAFLPMPPDAPWQDWAIAVAVARQGEVDYVAEPVLRYRHHGANNWAATTGDARVRALQKDLRFRRTTIAGLRPGELGAVALLDIVSGLLLNIRQLAAAAGLEDREVVEVTADEQLRGARLLLRADELQAEGRLDESALALAQGVAHDPLRATEGFAAAIRDRLRRRRLDAPGPAWPGAVPAEALLAGAGPVVVAHAAELVDDPALLAAFAEGTSTGTTLLVYAPDEAPHAVVEGLLPAAAAAGVDLDALDVALAAVPSDDELEHRLGHEAVALLTRHVETTGLVRLPHAEDAHALRRLLRAEVAA